MTSDPVSPIRLGSIDAAGEGCRPADRPGFRQENAPCAVFGQTGRQPGPRNYDEASGTTTPESTKRPGHVVPSVRPGDLLRTPRRCSSGLAVVPDQHDRAAELPVGGV